VNLRKNITHITKYIHHEWEIQPDLALKQRIGEQFYKDRENNIIGSWTTFLDKQDPSLLPVNWDGNKHNIALFTSSEDEFMSISNEWDNPFFESQLDGLRFVANIISSEPTYHLYVRVHPNTKYMAKAYVDSIQEIGTYSNVTLIDSDSNISTYQLLNKCNKVITFGSTLGMEAVYRKKPSILLSKCFYYFLKGPFLPKHTSEIKFLVLNANLQIPEEDECIKYAYFLNNFGIKYKYYEPTSYKLGTFKGVDLDIFPEKKTSFFAKVKDKIKFEYQKITEK
jgi:hypothetical protein